MKMDLAEAKAIIKYVKSKLSDVNNLNRGLKEIKERIVKDQKNSHLFRKYGLTSILIELLENPNEDVLKWTLSVLYLCILEKEFQKEVHDLGILHLFNVFKSAKSEAIQQIACTIIGRQCSYVDSCWQFLGLKATKVIISLLQETDSDVKKVNVVSTLRRLAHTPTHQNIILKEDGLSSLCQLGLSETCQPLLNITLSTILHFNKWPSPIYFNQLIRGTDNFLAFTKLYYCGEDEVKNQVLTIFLTVFSHHSSCSTIHEYRKNCETLDYLCMAKLPIMIVSELQTKPDNHELILALCKFCELNSQWRNFSNNVLPTYHERTWMQLTDCRGIALLISLLYSKRGNLGLLQALFRGLLGLEYLHSNRIKAIVCCLDAKLLPLLGEIFDDALKEICDYLKDCETETCHHFSAEAEPDRKKFDFLESSKEILELIENTPPASSRAVKDGEPQDVASKSDTGLVPHPKPTPTVSYKKMNKIKFRTGRQMSDPGENRKRRRYSQGSPTDVKPTSPLSPVHPGSEKKSEQTVQKSNKTLDKQMQMWINVLEYIVRLLYQVVSIKEDITLICREFLSRFYNYLSKACIVHPSALKLLSAIAKNSSSIQYVLDILFIPKLAVDLVHEKLSEDCPQCALITEGVNAFLVKLRNFFNHHHQYGQCEVANRLNPSKPDNVKHTCLVAITHVVKCPKLLHSFLLDHRGLSSLFHLLNPALNGDTQLRSYGLSSLCSIGFSLKSEYCSKYANNCLFCEASHLTLTNYFDLEKKEKRKQLSVLTSSTQPASPTKTVTKCNLEQEKDKNYSFKFEDRTIFVNKERLSLKNSVLKVLLQGSFGESAATSVSIKGVNSVSMEMVLHFLYGCTCDVLLLCRDTDVYVELFFLAQMYFIPELQIMALHHLALLLPPDGVYSLVEGLAGVLERDALQHLLCSLLSQPVSVHLKKRWMNQFLFSSALKDVFLDNVSHGLTNLLEKTSNLCNCDIYRSYE